MKLLLFFLLSLPAHAITWETCLSRADFNLNADSFVKSSKVIKAGCLVRFFDLSEKKEKIELDLCDPNVHLNTFPSADSILPSRIDAGSSNCPLPLFGSDIDTNSGDAQKFNELRAKVQTIFKEVERVYAEHIAKIDLGKINDQLLSKSDYQVACTKQLLDDYLNKCTYFEMPKEPKTPAVLKALPAPKK